MWKKIGIRKTSNDPMSPGSETPERSYKRKFPLRDPIDYNKFTRSNSPKSLNASKTELSLQSSYNGHEKSLFVGFPSRKNGLSMNDKEVISILKKRTLTQKSMNSPKGHQNLFKSGEETPKKFRESISMQMFHNSIQKNRAEKVKYSNFSAAENPNTDRLMEEILKLRTQLRKVTLQNNLYKNLIKDFKAQFKTLSLTIQKQFTETFQQSSSFILEMARFTTDHPIPTQDIESLQQQAYPHRASPRYVLPAPSLFLNSGESSPVDKIMDAVESIRGNILKRHRHLGDLSIKDIFQERRQEPLNSSQMVTFNKIMLGSLPRSHSKK